MPNNKKFKPVQVFWNGKPLKKIYPYATKFEVFKYKLKKLFRKLILGIIGISIIVYAFYLFRLSFPNIQYKVVEREVIIDNLTAKITEMKGEILSDLKKGESSNAPESAGIIIFDSNKLASIGSYQFQTKTVIYYYKKFYGQEITQKDAILIALDDNKAGELASKIIFSEKDGWRNWYNTGRTYNFEKRLDTIRTLEK